MAHHDHDDLDRLLAETTPPPPPDLAARVLRRAAVVRRRGRLTAALTLDAAALLALVLLAAHLGQAVVSDGLAELLALAVQDRALLRDHATDLAWAIVLAAPWPHVLAVAADLLAITVLTAYLLRAAPMAATGEGG
jgi:hypothetical protein